MRIMVNCLALVTMDMLFWLPLTLSGFRFMRNTFRRPHMPAPG